MGIVFKEVGQPRGTTIMKLLDERFSEAPLTFLRTTKVGVLRVVFCLGVLVRVAGYGGALCGGVVTRQGDFCFLSFLSFRLRQSQLHDAAALAVTIAFAPLAGLFPLHAVIIPLQTRFPAIDPIRFRDYHQAIHNLRPNRSSPGDDHPGFSLNPHRGKGQ